MYFFLRCNVGVVQIHTTTLNCLPNQENKKIMKKKKRNRDRVMKKQKRACVGVRKRGGLTTKRERRNKRMRKKNRKPNSRLRKKKQTTERLRQADSVQTEEFPLRNSFFYSKLRFLYACVMKVKYFFQIDSSVLVWVGGVGANRTNHSAPDVRYQQNEPENGFFAPPFFYSLSSFFSSLVGFLRYFLPKKP